MTKDMSSRNRPKFNIESRLTLNGRWPAGERLGSAPKGNETGAPGVSRAGVRRFFAPGTPASAAVAPGRSGGPQADVDELVASLVRPGLAAGGDVAPAAAAEPVGGFETEASIWSGIGATVTGPDVEPAVVPTPGSGVQVLAAATRSGAFTASPPAAGLVAGA